ncbi:MAG: winged helix-turn-helix transcriptional regulator [Gammaproteobacteria bacterium]|nr:winged helix-turn-helix transcriptional regulator [Gammaproteobacteria bacterium]
MIDVFESVGRAISDRNRIRILKMLEPGELCVCQITAILGLAPASASKHLSLLRMAGLLTHRKDGRWVYYRLSAHPYNPYAPAVLDVLRASLADDSVIAEDRRRLLYVNSISMPELIKAGPRLFEHVPLTPASS